MSNPSDLHTHMPKKTPLRRKPARSKPAARARLSAANADPRRLYELAVQTPDAEIDFVATTFRRLTGRPAKHLREDFCASAASACEWVRRRPSNSAVGLDLNKAILAWGIRHNVGALPEADRERIRLIHRDVLDPGAEGAGADIVLAMNFSYWIFKTRPLLKRYFETVHRSLVKDGVFFLDIYGGYESMKVQCEKRREKGFTYIWDQADYNPINGDLTCHIHFAFKRGPRLEKAFTYHWRLWTCLLYTSPSPRD